MRVIILLLFLAACAYSPTSARYVVDGDTFVLNNGSTVRLTWIDTPERGDINYDRAAYELQRRITGRQLRLEGEGTDVYGRLLRDVYVDDMYVNLEMVKEGWARVYRPGNEQFDIAQLQAQEASKGIWNIDDRQYKRFSKKCEEFGCPQGTVAVASKDGDVFYGCYCSRAYLIKNIICLQSVRQALETGLYETRSC